MLKLYLDENLPESIAKTLILRGYDVLTTFGSGNTGKSDKEQIEFASDDDRALVTFNIKHFSKLHIEYLKSGMTHKGIIFVKQMSLGEILNGLINVILTKRQDEIENNVVWLSQFIRKEHKG